MEIEVIVRWQIEETGTVKEPRIVVKWCRHSEVRLRMLLAHELGPWEVGLRAHRSGSGRGAIPLLQVKTSSLTESYSQRQDPLTVKEKETRGQVFE
ncbi:hypothetical protein FQN49_003353 [Arthroderma sp. PD_2]|nr:hypothetical protein FQN49_003353 [Arthroderma sp. PD_2]